MQNFLGRLGMGKKHKRRGPQPNHLQIDDDWENAVKKVIQKKN